MIASCSDGIIYIDGSDNDRNNRRIRHDDDYNDSKNDDDGMYGINAVMIIFVNKY